MAGPAKDPSALLARLEDQSTDSSKKALVLVEARDCLEQWVQGGYLPTFMSRWVPLLLRLLDAPIPFSNLSPEQRLRAGVYELFHRLPIQQAEIIRPHAPAIFDKLIDLFLEENEDNAVMIIKVFMDFQRGLAQELGDRISKFLNAITELFANMERVIKTTFSDANPPNTRPQMLSQAQRSQSPAVGSTDAQGQQEPPRQLLKSIDSFKVLAECPITVVSIFQAHRRLMTENMPRFVPLIKQLLQSQALPQEEAHREAAARGEHFIGVAPGIKDRKAYSDLITAQVKTISFMAYILKSQPQLLKDFVSTVPEIIVRLLKDCPKEKCSVRKELLVAIRHIVSFNFRVIFISSLDDLLNERILLGDGMGAAETQKGLAYSLLADLIHHLRESLTDHQIKLVVRGYTKNMKDTVPGTSFQTMSAKLLSAVAEKIAKMDDKRQARVHLISILDAIGDKLADMNRTYPNAAKLAAQGDQQSGDSVTPADFLVDKEHAPDWDEIDIFTVTPIKIANARDRGVEPLYDNKFLIKNLLGSLKGLLFQLNKCNGETPVSDENLPSKNHWESCAFGFNADEVAVLRKVLHEGIASFQYYPPNKFPTGPSVSPLDLIGSYVIVETVEEKEILETFATVFHHIDSAVFHEIFGFEIPFLYESIFEHPGLLQIPQFLLASEATSPHFAGMLLEFLMSHIHEVGSSDTTKTTILLRLFKLSFMAVTLFVGHNEAVLLPHIHKLITHCLEISTTADEPMNFYYLLRSLFRSIGGGKFEQLYKEILPLLEMLLERLNNLIACARNVRDRDLFVELSLTVPARLSHLLPHLSYLMKPLVLALQTSSELVGQGLRTLELCVDNLTAEYLDPIMAPVIHDLMAALWSHLQPAPYPIFHAHTTMRILGKLGGRNRRFIEGPPSLDYQESTSKPTNMVVRLVGSPIAHEFPAFIGVSGALNKIEETFKKGEAPPNDAFYKQQALDLVISQTQLLLKFDKLPDDLARLVRLQADDLRNEAFDRGATRLGGVSKPAPSSKRQADRQLLKDLVRGIMLATSLPALKSQASDFLDNLYRHFAIIEVGTALMEAQDERRIGATDAGHLYWTFDHRIMQEVIIDCLSSDRSAVKEAARHAILSIRAALGTILGNRQDVLKVPFFSSLLASCCHACHKEDWWMVAGAASGIKLLAEELGTELFVDKQVDLAKALIYAAKDLPEVVPKSVRTDALDSLKIVIRVSNQHATADDLALPQSRLCALCAALIPELASISMPVRTAVQECLSLLAGLLHSTVHEIVAPRKMNVLSHIFTKPLRSVTEQIQVGYIEAITFLLGLGNGVLEQNESFSRFLGETVQLVSQEEDPINPQKSNDERYARNVINLKVSCLHLLSKTLEYCDAENQSMQRVRPRIISIFFKSLYSRHEDIVDAGNEALKIVVVKDAKLPKDILQNGLRPILVSLGEPDKLRIQHMKTLARLLSLLKSYFKVEIGQRLLDNIFSVVDRDTLQKASFQHLDQQERVKVLAAVFNVFHLLPEAAQNFMAKLVTRAIELEQSLRRTTHSPLRPPVIKYINRYPERAWDDHFSQTLADREHSRFLAQILASPDSEALRMVLVKRAPDLVKGLSEENLANSQWTVIINTVNILTSLCPKAEALGTEAIFKIESVMSSLFAVSRALGDAVNKQIDVKYEGESPSDQLGYDLALAAEQAREQVLRLLVLHFDQDPGDLSCLFQILESVADGSVPDIASLWQSCIHRNLLIEYNAERWKSVMDRCLKTITSKDIPEVSKVIVWRALVIPMFAKDIMTNWATLSKGAKETPFMTSQLMKAFKDQVWTHQAVVDAKDENTPIGTEATRMEILQMATLLLKYCSAVTTAYDGNREIVRMGFSYTKLEDVLNKFAAHVTIAYYVQVFSAPAKVAMTVYQPLIKAHVSEARILVTQGLEVLAPFLTKLAEDFTSSSQTSHAWVMFAQRPIKEDPANLQQTQSILTFIARHPDLFYEARDFFAMTLFQVLPRVVPLPVVSLDYKKMVLSMLNLIWKWQERYVKEASGVQSEPVAATPFVQSTSSRTMIFKYLATFIMTVADRFVLRPRPKDEHPPQGQPQASSPSNGPDIIARSLELFKNLWSSPHWSDIDPAMLFQRLHASLNQESSTSPEKEVQRLTVTINTLQLLRVIVNVRSHEWINSHLNELQGLLEKLLRNPAREIQECLFEVPEQSGEGSSTGESLVGRIINALPAESAPDEMDETEENAPDFLGFLLTTANDTLSGATLPAAVNIFRCIAASRPRKIDPHWNELMKSIGEAARQYSNIYQQQMQELADRRPITQEMATQRMQTQHALDAIIDTLVKMIDLFGQEIAHLGDNRRPYLQLLTQLAEKAASKRISMKMLDLVTWWVFDPEQPLPNVKEKNAVILRMIPYIRREQELGNKYLDLIARIYEDPKVTRSELAIRLEAAFLAGTSADNLEMRNRFISIFDRHLSRSANTRLLYLLAAQEWAELKDKFWLNLVIELLANSFEQDSMTSLKRGNNSVHPMSAFARYEDDDRLDSLVLDDSFETFMAAHQQSCGRLRTIRARDVIRPLANLQLDNSEVSRDIWHHLFPLLWSVLIKEERSELSEGLISLSTKEYHHEMMDRRPNCVQVLVEGIARTSKPRINFPPHVMKYLARTYDSWYSSMCYMEENAYNPIVDTPAARESNQDALAETYAALEETDMFYGLWRRRTDFLETLTALSFEQHGDWNKAQVMFEQATIKARTGAKPFKQGEYQLWEDHYVRCAQKLQQWDVLNEFARTDDLRDLFLDAVWRNIDTWHKDIEQSKQLDNIIKMVSDAPTPRRYFFQSFKALLHLHRNQFDQESQTIFTRSNDEAIQLSIRKWHQLPKRITAAHIPVLQNFQQLCELFDASVICNTIANTAPNNLDQKAPELKLQLNTWRDRLPNFWDDITAWQELVTWRQHIFHLINKKYLHIIPNQQAPGSTTATQNSLAFRGYHETASIINRFAHVARKHSLPDVCINQLSKIYTLPNIEIQEAFLKLREQAKCHYHTEGDLQTGLDVINNTNLNYFGPQQKAEFYVLKGMFLAKQKDNEQANDAFGSALYFDLKLPKAWAEWARYNDALFKDNNDISAAAAAISCYLEAASTYKSSKARKFLSRILWLLSLDDANGTLVTAFESFQSDLTPWYWITFVPQLLTGLSKPEGRVLQKVLQQLAKSYPQALFYSLRTSREDLASIKKQQQAKEAKTKQQQQQGGTLSGAQSSPTGQGSPTSRPVTADGRPGSTSRPTTAQGELGTLQVNGQAGSNEATPKQGPSAQGSPNIIKSENHEQHSSSPPNRTQNQNQQSPSQIQKEEQPQEQVKDRKPRQPWEYTDEIYTTLKTAFPLLAISLEIMCEQLHKHMRMTPDEDAYRLISALQNDACSYLWKSPMNFSKEYPVPPSTEQNVARFADAVLSSQPALKRAFEQDFVTNKPSLYEYMHKLRRWRDRFEEKLNNKPNTLTLESISPMLSDFKFQKFDEVEVPGQYLQHRDTNKDFVRIDRFIPDVDVIRGQSNPSRRLWIRGHDGSKHPFMVLYPTSKLGRRDERMLQAIRFFNDVLGKRKESRRRNLQFHAPSIIPISPIVRIAVDDPSYITLQAMYDNYATAKSMPKDEPLLFVIQKLRDMRPHDSSEVHSIRQQAFEVIQNSMVPKTIVTDHFRASHPSFDDFWLLRKSVAFQLAAHSFLTYIFSMRERNPSRINISRRTGLIWGTELHPGWATAPQPRAHFGSNEAVPFRLTPNLQMFLGPIALEGVFAPAMLVIAKALTEPSGGTKLEQILSLFVRDEVAYWHAQNHKRDPDATGLNTLVAQNSERVVNKVTSLAMFNKELPLPINQSVLDLVARAADPAHLSQMDISWMPWL